MSEHKHIVIPRVLCFVFNKDSVLMLKASREKDWFGYYQPPGGHIEKGEDVFEAAEKEIFEETGIKVKGTKLVGVIHVSGFFGKEIMLFVTKSLTDKEELSSSHEGEAVWIRLDKLDEVNLLEDTKPMLEKILTMKKGEIFVGTSEFDGKNKLNSLKIKVN